MLFDWFALRSLKLGSKQGVPSNAKEMIEAMDLLSSLDSETQAIVAAQRQLQRVINEVEISQVAGPLESALEQAKEARTLTATLILIACAAINR